MSLGKHVFRAVIMGAPASGKGTISERIIKKFNLHHLSCGDILRQNIQLKTALGEEAQKYISVGKLVPDELVIKCILDKIKELPEESSSSWLLDGFPRTIEQANKLAAAEKLDAVINLVVPHDVIIDRVKGRWMHLPSGRVYNVDFNKPKVPFKDDVTGEPLVQREDDKPETVKKRLDIYEQFSKPLIEYYAKKNLLIEFEGRTSNEIWPKVQTFLEKKIKD